MSVFRYLLPTIAAALAVTSYGVSQSPDVEKDSAALKEFTKQKRNVAIRDIGGELSLSGDVRFEYQSLVESSESSANRASQRGSGTGYANHQFDAEVNLMLDYRADRNWAAVKIEFDNNAGDTTTGNVGGTSTALGSGSESSVKLQRAYVGYNVMEEDTARLDVEFGRRKLYDLFHSKVQFAGTMDGMVLKYANSFEAIGDFYANGGTWIVDDVVDHYAWAVELGLMDIADTGLYARYSYVDWDKSGADRWGNKPGQVLGATAAAGKGRYWQSRNSELSFGYKMMPEMLRMDVNLYGSYLVNHAADSLIKTGNKKRNKAWALGVALGKLEYAGDWSLDLSYQSVGAQAVLDHDVSGIGRGNTAGNHFANWADNATELNAKNGAANYKGYALEAGYNVTDNWTWVMEYETSSAMNKTTGGYQSYKKFEVESIFTF